MILITIIKKVKMSNFNCEICGLPILENENGQYYTGCSHYPIECLNSPLRPPNMIQCTHFKFPEIEVNINDL